MHLDSFLHDNEFSVLFCVKGLRLCSVNEVLICSTEFFINVPQDTDGVHVTEAWPE